MPVDKSSLFESTKALWPTKMDLSRDPDALNKIYRANEAAHSVGDHWRQLAIWAFHQALNVAAAENGASVIFVDAVDATAFDRWMRSNLAHECWADELAEYDS
uniref:hypothetical protein n=1 Tax=Edaphosphingomonas laterariae TaxID=861865 RepID=UPI001181B2DB|nr:hypothetical protein [Sphingomonas laterariae]